MTSVWKKPVGSAGAVAALCAICMVISVLVLPACQAKRDPRELLRPASVEVDPDERVPPPLRVAWTAAPDERGRLPVDPEEGARRPTLSPALGTVAYLAYGDVLEARRLTDGHLMRSARLPGELAFRPLALPGGVVALTADSALWLDDELRPRALVPLDGAPAAATLVGDLLALSDGNGIRALRLDGEAWSAELDGVLALGPGEEASTLYATLDGGRLLALDVATGSRRWSVELGGQLPSEPAVAGGRLYVAGTGNRLLALDAEDGDRIWERRLGADVVGSPVVVDDLVWVAGFDSQLLGYTASGTELYRYPLPSRTYVDLAAWGPWVVVGPRYGPWKLVQAPRQRSSISPGNLLVIDVPANPSITLAPASAPAGVLLVADDGTLRFLDPDPRDPPSLPEAPGTAER